jgi:predicted MFS family arabinose efflux permease
VKNATRRRAVLMLCSMLPLVVLSQFYRSSIGVIAPNLSDEFQLPPQQLGLLSSSFFLVFAALQIPIGILLDRFGGRRVLPSMMTLTIAGALIFALAPSFGWIMSGRVLIGIGCAGLMIGSLAILSRWYSRERFATAMSILFGCANAGGLIATLPLAAATDAWGWRMTFAGLALLSLLLTIVFYSVVRDVPPGQAGTRPVENLAEVAAGVRDVFAIRDVLLLLPLISVGYASTIAVLGLWGGPYLHDVYGLHEVGRGNVLSLMAIAMIFGTFVYGPLDRRYNTRRGVVSAGAIATMVPLALLSLFPRTSTAGATLLLVLFGFISAYSLVVMAHGLSLVPERLAGRGAAVLNTALMGGAGLVQWLTGYVMKLSLSFGSVAHSYALVFATLAALTAAALLLYRRASDVRPRDLAVLA